MDHSMPLRVHPHQCQDSHQWGTDTAAAAAAAAATTTTTNATSSLPTYLPTFLPPSLRSSLPLKDTMPIRRVLAALIMRFGQFNADT